MTTISMQDSKSCPGLWNKLLDVYGLYVMLYLSSVKLSPLMKVNILWICLESEHVEYPLLLFGFYPFLL